MTTVFANRYAGLSNGGSGNTFTVTATASAGNPFILIFAASATPTPSAITDYAQNGVNPPLVFVGGVAQLAGGVLPTQPLITTPKQLWQTWRRIGATLTLLNVRSAVNTGTDMRQHACYPAITESCALAVVTGYGAHWNQWRTECGFRGFFSSECYPHPLDSPYGRHL